MLELRGVLYDGKSSRARDATLRVFTDGTARVSTAAGEQRLLYADLGIPPRLGSTPRRVMLPEGGCFETPDNDTVDAIEDAHGRRHHGWLHRLESRLPLVVVAALFMVVALALFAVKGVPAIARAAAFATPAETSDFLARGTLEILDRSFEPSELPRSRQRRLERLFQRIVSSAGSEARYELVFRGGGPFGANAFALPSGAIILTDELVELAERDEEIEAVLAHEVGHVVNRHGLRQAIQSSLLALALFLVTGDVSATSGVVAGLPTVLAEARYSRQFEREADAYAVAYLEIHGIDPAHFARLLARLEAGDDFVDLSFLSTHPATEERIARLAGGRDVREAP